MFVTIGEYDSSRLSRGLWGHAPSENLIKPSEALFRRISLISFIVIVLLLCIVHNMRGLKPSAAYGGQNVQC